MTHIRTSPRRRRSLSALAVALVMACGAAQAQTAAGRSNRSADFIVAVVNTDLVTSVELNQRIERVSAEARRNGTPLPDADTLRQQVLDALIDDRVQTTYARDAGQRVDEVEIDRAIANIAAQNQLTAAQLRERLQADGMDIGRFRANLRDQILLDRVREREVNSRIRISDADIDRWLEEQRAKLQVQAELNLAQILVTVPEGASAEVVAQRLARANQALARLRSGENFSVVARELSEDGNREAGGEIGMRPASRLPDLFVEAAKTLTVGQLSAQPLRSAAGFHILKLVDRSSDDPLTIIQTQVRHILLRVSDRSQAQLVAQRLDSLRQQIERGEKKFEEVAREVSEDGSAPAGGDLGWTSPGNLVPEFEEAMNKLPLGGISPPVASRFGIHLLQVLNRRSAQIEPKTVRDQARNQLRESKFESTYQDWAKDLRLRAFIEMREPPLN